MIATLSHGDLVHPVRGPKKLIIRTQDYFCGEAPNLEGPISFALASLCAERLHKRAVVEYGPGRCPKDRGRYSSCDNGARP